MQSRAKERMPHLQCALFPLIGSRAVVCNVITLGDLPCTPLHLPIHRGVALGMWGVYSA